MGEHRIARQIIEVVAGDRASAAALADRVAAAAPLVAATLARRFDAIEDGCRRRIERLVLTLDPCDRSDFEANLLANLDAALARALPEQLARVAIIDPAEDALDLIAAFLRRGVLPWWSGAHDTALAEAAETLIGAENSGNPPGAAALRQLLGEVDTATRLVRALPTSILPRLAAWLADLRAEDLDTLAIMLTAERGDADPAAAATFVWSGIMVAAAQEAPRSTPEAFASEVRACLARSEGRSEMQHLQTAPLAAASDLATPPTEVDESRPVPRPSETRNGPGPGRDTTLAREESPSTGDSGDSPSPQEAPPTDDDGNLPSPEDAPPTDDGGDSPPDPGSRPASEQLPDTASPDIGPPASRPSEARKKDLEPGRDPTPAREDDPPGNQGGNLPPDPQFRPASHALPDDLSPDIGPPPSIVNPVPAEPPWTGREGATAMSDAREPQVEPPDRDGRPAGEPPSDNVGSGPVRDRAGQPTAYSPPDGETARQIAASTATEHDSIYIHAAGIILLGPFLSDYFAAAGLIDSECRFTTPAARHHAVALIDYLATADPDPPESHLALAKLLAGMPIDTVLRTRPLDEAEAMSAEALLAAVLAELPMLGRLTVNGFRSAWLNRPGLLTVEQGSWLLRIERRSWDMLLDRLEWSTRWLQLPWQPEGIRIEW